MVRFSGDGTGTGRVESWQRAEELVLEGVGDLEEAEGLGGPEAFVFGQLVDETLEHVADLFDEVCSLGSDQFSLFQLGATVLNDISLETA